MNAKHIVGAGIMALVTTACGYGIKTSSDYDRRVSFSDYRSFFMVKGNPSGDPLKDQRARADVEAALIVKGWLEVPEGEGHAAVVLHAATRDKHTYQALYDGWGGWRYRWGGAGATFVEDYKVGTLVIDIFDAKTKQALWHGFASDALLGNAKATGHADAAEEAINKMFRTFPPPAGVASAQ
jgi:hypothetical protein